MIIKFISLNQQQNKYFQINEKYLIILTIIKNLSILLLNIHVLLIYLMEYLNYFKIYY
jgi:hypothetical protein